MLEDVIFGISRWDRVGNGDKSKRALPLLLVIWLSKGVRPAKTSLTDRLSVVCHYTMLRNCCTFVMLSKAVWDVITNNVLAVLDLADQ